MFAWQILGPKQIKKVSLTDNIEQLDDVKLRITKCLITKQDIINYLGSSSIKYPIIPSKIAIGIITETLEESNYFVKGTKAYITPNTVCHKCYKCLNNQEDECLNVQYASKDYDGFLKEFAVIQKQSCNLLVKEIKDYDALFLNHISLALSVIDKLKIEKGQHVCILGGSIFANILAQLIAYYQAVPILVDNVKQNLDIANDCGIYYTLLTDKTLEKQVHNITGGRKCTKIVYDTESQLSTDLISKLSATNAQVAISGMVETKTKITFDILVDTEINVKFIKNGSENITSGINILVQKILNLDCFDIPEYKFDYIDKHFETFASKILEDDNNSVFIVDLM